MEMVKAGDIPEDKALCPRCGEVHKEWAYYPLARPVVRYAVMMYNHYAVCPTELEPVVVLASDGVGVEEVG